MKKRDVGRSSQPEIKAEVRGEGRLFSAAQQIEVHLNNEVYKAAVGSFEQAEHLGLIAGNGHHCAQRVAAEACAIFKRHLTRTTHPNPADQPNSTTDLPALSVERLRQRITKES
jgi:hypothetical protein